MRLSEDQSNIDRVKRFAARRAKRWPMLAEDIESEAMFALVEAEKTFDPTRVDWQIHLGRRLSCRYVDLIRREIGRSDAATSRSRRGFRLGLVDIAILDVEAANPGHEHAVEMWDTIERGFEELTILQREAMRLYLGESCGDLADIARRLGLSLSGATHRVAGAIRTLRRIFKDSNR